MSASKIFVESMIKEWVFHKTDVTFARLARKLRSSYTRYKHKRKAKCLRLKGIERSECYVKYFDGLINIHKKIIDMAKRELKNDPKKLKRILKKNQSEIDRLSKMVRGHKTRVLRKKKKETKKEKNK